MPRKGIVAAAVLAGFGLGSFSLAAQGSRFDENRNYDARAALQKAAAAAPTALSDAGLAEMRRAMPELLVSHDPATGAVRSLWNPAGTLTGPATGEPLEVALGYLQDHADLLGLSVADLAEVAVTDRVPGSGGAVHLYLRQEHLGLPVYNGQLQVHLDGENRILSVSNDFLPDLGFGVKSTVPAVDAGAAVRGAAQHLGIALRGTPQTLAAPAGVQRVTRLSVPELSTEPVEARLMLLPVQKGDARLVWNFQLYTRDSQHVWDLTVDAATAKVWTRTDQVASDTYRVYPRPVESPNHTTPLPPLDGRQLIANPASVPATSVSSPFGWHDTNGIAGPEFLNPRGNNAHAYEDSDANNLPPAVEPSCGAGLNCDFPINLTGAPSTYRPAAIANLFYWNNVIHDIQALYGFTSAAGNFQVNTYGAGGLGNDDVRAEAQDGGGINNANFFTPVDGQRPRMQMFLWNTAVPQKDGDLDSGVIVHEYGHGISNRLVGGPANVSCLFNAQQPGEGLSDWWSLAYTHEWGDQGTDPRGIGTYVLNQPVTGPGIRTQRYSTDPAVNTWTYASIAGMAIPHGVGSVWAQGAWEVYWKLVDTWGFFPYLYYAHLNYGNIRMMHYVNEGLKFTACSPTFTQVRDGILQAAAVNYGGIDVCRLWVAFANYGLGSNAISGGPNSTNPTNGFQVPASCLTNVWSKDKPWDTGLEPDPATAANNMWESEDIWVRNDATPGPHQNPEFGQTNYVWVKVRNLSATVEAVDVPVKVYYANASTGLIWPTNWTLIGTVNVGSLPPLAETEIQVPWSPPATGHFCLLSRLDTVQDPMTNPETPDVNFNTRFNNNIVWKNVNVVNLVPFQVVPVKFNVRNVLAKPVRLRLRVLEPEEQRGNPFLGRGRIALGLDDKLAEIFKADGQKSRGLKVESDGRTLLVDDVDAYLEAPVGAKEEFELSLTFEDTIPRDSRSSENEDFVEYSYVVVQEDAETGQVYGGITYLVRTPQ